MRGTPPTNLNKCKTAYWRISYIRCQAQYGKIMTGEKLYPDTPHSKSAEAFWNNPNRKFGFDK